MEELTEKTVSKGRKYDYVSSIFRHELYTPIVEQKIEFLMELPEIYFDSAFKPVYNAYDEFIGFKTDEKVFREIMNNFQPKEIPVNEDDVDYEYERMLD